MDFLLKKLKPTKHVDDHGRRLYELREDYVLKLGTTCHIIVPKGFVTNLASVPWGLQWLVPPTVAPRASLVHDFLISEDHKYMQEEAEIWCTLVLHDGFSRWLADSIFYELMTQDCVSLWRRLLLYTGVRIWALWSGA